MPSESRLNVRAIGYLSRQSAPDFEAPSLAEQNAQFLEFCQQHGYESVAAYLDAEPGGQRSGFAQLLQHLADERAGFTVVVVPAFKLLGSDANQSARALFQLRARGANIVSLTEGPLDDQTMLRLWERQKPRERSRLVHDAMRKRAVRGQVLGRPPFGYRIGADSRLEPNPEEAPVVEYIVHMYLKENLGIRRITQRLNDEGYRTRRNRNWSMVTIRDLLINRVYIGAYQRFGVSVPNNHAPLITMQQFIEIQQRMQSRRTAPGIGQRSHFLLAGLLWCGESGSRMIGVTRRQRWDRRDGGQGSATYRYYKSEARTNQSVGRYHTRRAEELEDEVITHLRRGADQLSQPVLTFAGDPNAVVAETATALSRMQSRLRALDRKLGHAMSAVSVGGGSFQTLRAESTQIIEEYERVQAEIERLQGRLDAHSTDEQRRKRRERLLDTIRDAWDDLDFEARRNLLADLVERVVVRDDSVQTILRP